LPKAPPGTGHAVFSPTDTVQAPPCTAHFRPTDVGHLITYIWIAFAKCIFFKPKPILLQHSRALVSIISIIKLLDASGGQYFEQNWISKPLLDNYILKHGVPQSQHIHGLHTFTLTIEYLTRTSTTAVSGPVRQNQTFIHIVVTGAINTSFSS
jgi:hypothetical protein